MKDMNWSVPPWGTDPRQYEDVPMVTGGGLPIRIERVMHGWLVWVGTGPSAEVHLNTDTLSELAWFLNGYAAHPVDGRAPAEGQLNLFAQGG